MARLTITTQDFTSVVPEPALSVLLATPHLRVAGEDLSVVEREGDMVRIVAVAAGWARPQNQRHSQPIAVSRHIERVCVCNDVARTEWLPWPFVFFLPHSLGHW